MSARLQGVAFVLLCVIGSVVAIGLTVREASRTPPVVVDLTSTSRSGLVTSLELSVRNTTDQARCVSVRIAARDRAGHDLGATTAAEALRLPAHATRRLSTRLTLTGRQYAEELDTFYPSADPCERAT
jgi:hypothetical protein